MAATGYQTGGLHTGPAVAGGGGHTAALHTGAGPTAPAMNVQGPPATPIAPAAPRSGGVSKTSSGGFGMLALGLTAFLLLWQIILLAVASRVLHRVNDLTHLRNVFFLGK